MTYTTNQNDYRLATTPKGILSNTYSFLLKSKQIHTHTNICTYLKKQNKDTAITKRMYKRWEVINLSMRCIYVCALMSKYLLVLKETKSPQNENIFKFIFSYKISLC